MKTDQNRLIMSMLSNGNGNHGSSKSISPSSTGSLNLKKSFRIDDLLSKKSARYGSPSSNNHYSSNNSNNSEESLQENDGSPPEGVRSQNQSHHQYNHNHRRGDHEQDQHNNNNSHHQHFINSHNNSKNNSSRIEADYPQERDRERDRDRDRDRRGSTKMISIVGKSDYPNQALITSRYSQSSERDRERDRDRDRDHPGLLRPNNSYNNNNNNNWEDEHHVNSLKLTELRKSYQQHHQQQQESSQQQTTYSIGRYEFDPNHHHHHPQSVRTSSPGPGPTPPTIPLPPLYLPEALAPPPPLSFSSMSQLTHYQEALQRYNDYITANNNASQIQIQQNPFGFYSSPSPNNPLHHPALSMSTLSAFRSLYPSAGPGDPLASLSPDDLATARNSFSHSTNGLYAAASLAYLGRNPPSFSMPSLLGHNDGNKRKGGQIRFTNYQTSQLEKSFMDHKYLNANDRKKLATSLGLSDRQVKTWFQNRRAKWRKCKEIHCQDIEGEMNKCSSSDRQSYSPDPGNCESPATSGPEDDEHSP